MVNIKSGTFFLSAALQYAQYLGWSGGNHQSQIENSTILLV